MELSESVQRGLQSLADPSSFDRRSYQVLVDVSFRSLLSSQADPSVLGEPIPAFCLRSSFRFLPVGRYALELPRFLRISTLARLRAASRP